MAKIDDEFKREVAVLKGLLSVHKGAAAEYRVRYRLLVASLRGATLADVTTAPSSEIAEGNAPVGPYALIRKARFYVDQEKSVEVDLHAVHEADDGTDLMIEVKDWENPPSMEIADDFDEPLEDFLDYM